MQAVGSETTLPWLMKGRVPSLDGLRGLAILLVLVGHSVAFQTDSPHLAWTRLGEWGVDLFFAISGFIITLLLLREWNHSGTISLPNFYLRRALRILPPYAAFLGFVFLGEWLRGPHLESFERFGLLTMTLNLFLIKSHYAGHIWSLSLEEQFYLLWPGILWCLGPRRGLYAALVVVLIVPAMRYLVQYYVPGSLVYNSTPTRLDGIMTGCIVALLATGMAGPRLKAVGSIGSLLVLLVGALFVLFRNWCEEQSDSYLYYHSGSAIAMATILWFVVSAEGGWVAWFFQQRWITTFGLLSYSLYLWQQPFLYRRSNAWWTTFPWNLAIIFAIASISYYCLEKPLLRWREQLRSKVE